MRRLLIVTLNGDPLAPLGSLHAGGQCGYVLELSKGLLHRGWGVHILTLQNPGTSARETWTFDVDVWRVPLPDRRAYDGAVSTADLEFVTSSFLEIVARDGIAFDGVLACYWISAVVGLEVARHVAKPLVISFCSLGIYKQAVDQSEQTRRRIERERNLAAEADHIIATNYEEAQTLKLSYGVNPSKLSIIPRGVDLEVFHPRR